MKKYKLQFGAVLIGGMLLAACQSYGQQEFILSYSGSYTAANNTIQSMTGSGDIWATPNGDGSSTVTAGNFNWATGPYAASGALVPLTTAPSPGTPGFSGSTFIMYGGDEVFPVDNKIYPGQTALLTPSGGLGVQNSEGGLAFNDPSFVGPGGTGMAFVIYANFSGGPNNYGVVFDAPNDQPYLADFDGGTVSLAAAPESAATTRFAGLSALGLLGLAMFRKKFSPVG